jgi:endoglucanase
VLLEDISNARGVSGNEGAVRDVLLAAVKDRIDEHRVDALGNLICLRRARRAAAVGGPRTVMVAAHMDEIGLIVTGINSDGSLRFARVGGIDERILLSKAVLVGEKAVPGIIGYRPIHLIPGPEREKAADVSHAAIDIGATSKGGAERLVKLGDYVTFATRFELLGDEPDQVAKGRAFDDRAGCGVLCELLKGDYAFDLYAVFTAQEEVGLRGSTVAAHAVAPEIGLVLEGTVCDDLPRKKDVTPVTEVGKGPAISVADHTAIADARLVKLLVRAAQEQGIPYQFKRMVAGGTDAGALHLSRAGVPTVALSTPVRYLHAPTCLMSLTDYNHTVQLATAALHLIEGGLDTCKN